MTLKEFLTDWHSSSPRMLVHTSGSTGAPKPMWVEKQRMCNSARITCDFLRLHPGDSALLCMSLDYIAGKMMVVRAIERQLDLISVAPSSHPLRSLTRPVTFAAMVPMQVFNSLQVPEERERLRQIKHLIIGGGAIDDLLAVQLRSFPNAVWSTYGMTETLSHIALRRLSGPTASDYYTPFDTVTVGLNAAGCLVIDAPLVCEYPVVTNDIAEICPDRTDFRILGRLDNVIDSGGIKIQIEEVERVLRPYLTSSYVITKCSDSKFGEIVVLLTTSNDIGIVQEICRRVLPKYWQPKRYLSIRAIPMTETGKIDRAEAMILGKISRG